VRLAGEAIAGITRRGKIPVVAGGTGFYLKNLILGLPEAPPADTAIRAALKLELQEKGAAALMEELANLDPVSANKIHINDEYRLLRALEVQRLTGQPLSSFRVTGDQRKPEFRFFVYGIFRHREELYRRINTRCAAMFRQSNLSQSEISQGDISPTLPDEVRRLFNAGYTPRDPGLRAIGYREFFIEDEPGIFRISQDLTGVQALVAQNSRHYAKRQITFFNSLPDAKWIKAGNDAETANLLRDAICENLTVRTAL